MWDVGGEIVENMGDDESGDLSAYGDGHGGVLVILFMVSINDSPVHVDEYGL